MDVSKGNFNKMILKQINYLKRNFIRNAYLVTHDTERCVTFNHDLYYYWNYIKLNIRPLKEDLNYILNRYIKIHDKYGKYGKKGSFSHTQPNASYVEDNEIKLLLIHPKFEGSGYTIRGPLSIPSLEDVKTLKTPWITDLWVLGDILKDMSSRYTLITSDIIYDGKRIDEDFYKGVKISNRINPKEIRMSSDTKFKIISSPVNVATIMEYKEIKGYIVGLFFEAESQRLNIENVTLILLFNSQGKLKIIDREYQVSGIVKIQLPKSYRSTLITSYIISSGKMIEEDFYEGVKISTLINPEEVRRSSDSKLNIISSPVKEAIILEYKKRNAYMINLFFKGDKFESFMVHKNDAFIVSFSSQGKLKIIDKEYQVSGVVKIQFS
ncbi:hypothetical protein [Caldisericum sp.]|uniref:hypothetical protein n=1 Tax=Caldisericum sp. TaxID=2499687 RepID=UPI003D0AE13A